LSSLKIWIHSPVPVQSAVRTSRFSQTNSTRSTDVKGAIRRSTLHSVNFRQAARIPAPEKEVSSFEKSKLLPDPIDTFKGVYLCLRYRRLLLKNALKYVLHADIKMDFT